MTQDFIDITSTVYQYAYGIDLRDWDMYRNIFNDDLHMDFSSYSGAPASSMTADQWVAGVKPLFTGLDATQHTMTNPLVTIDRDIDRDRDRARCRMYMQAEHFFKAARGNPEYAIGGYYDDTLIRTEAGWKITAVKLTVFWHRGNPDLMIEAREYGLQKLKAAE